MRFRRDAVVLWRLEHRIRRTRTGPRFAVQQRSNSFETSAYRPEPNRRLEAIPRDGRRDDADAAKKNDLLQPDLNLGKEPTSFAGDDLRHPFTHIHAAYNIVIGRRDELDDVSNYVRNSYRSLHRVQVCTYDRFVQVARNADRNDWLTRKGAA